MALGYFARQLAQRGLVALLLAQSPEYVAPHGAAQAVFGTNPIAVGIPTGEGGAPLVLDMATSAHSWWGVMEAAAAGRPLPPGVAQDASGVPTQDPAAVLAGGALLSFDRSHKGSALGLIVELLGGSLVGAAARDKAAARDWGNLVIAIDPGLLGPPAAFQARVRAVLQRVKAAPALAGCAPPRLPGERGDALARQRLRSAVLPVEANLWASLQRCAAEGPEGAEPPLHSDGVSLRPPAAPAAAAAPADAGWSIDTRLVHPRTEGNDPYRGERHFTGRTRAPRLTRHARAQPPRRRCTRRLHSSSLTRSRSARSTTRAAATPRARCWRGRWRSLRAPTAASPSPPAWPRSRPSRASCAPASASWRETTYTARDADVIDPVAHARAQAAHRAFSPRCCPRWASWSLTWT